jgi:antitoxin HicB
VLTLSAVIGAKAALYTAMRAQGLSNSALARTLDCAEGGVRRMLDPRHATIISRLEEVLAVLSKRLVVEVATK